MLLLLLLLLYKRGFREQERHHSATVNVGKYQSGFKRKTKEVHLLDMELGTLVGKMEGVTTRVKFLEEENIKLKSSLN